MIRRFFRKIFRIIRLLLWMPNVGLRTIFALRGKSPDERIQTASRYTIQWAVGIRDILNVKTHIHGKTPETGGVLLVSNHLGYLDIIIHASFMGVRFAPKKEIRSWPVLGPYLGLSQPVWIDRKNRSKSQESLREFEKTLELEVPLIVYPEGTSTDGLHGLLPFKSTPFEAAIRNNRPIQPVITRYRVPEGAMNPAWFGDQELLPHVWELLGIPEIHADIHLLPPIYPNNYSNRKQLAEAVREEMMKVYRNIMETGGEKTE